jgi:hypothetical protein
MQPRNSRRRRLLVAGLLIVFLGALGAIAITQSNDFVCSDAERRAMSEFPHYDGATPDWESNAKITGGCTTSYIVTAQPEEALAHYREQLAQRGWTIIDAPANTFPIYVEANREELRYFLMFEGAGQEQEGPGLQPDQTRVSISGGHRR